jgi:hypothetical protein
MAAPSPPASHIAIQWRAKTRYLTPSAWPLALVIGLASSMARLARSRIRSIGRRSPGWLGNGALRAPIPPGPHRYHCLRWPNIWFLAPSGSFQHRWSEMGARVRSPDPYPA